MTVATVAPIVTPSPVVLGLAVVPFPDSFNQSLRFGVLVLDS